MWAADWNSTDVSLDFTTDAAVLNIVDPGEQNWNIQLVQEGLAFVKDQEYTVTFDADSTVARDITFKLSSTEFSNKNSVYLFLRYLKFNILRRRRCQIL